MRFYLYCILFIFANLISYTLEAQLISFSGNIKNKLTNEVIQNVAVYESVSGIGTITNPQGYFKLMLKKGHKKIQFSETGFSPQTIKFNLQRDTILNVVLLEDQIIQSKKTENNSPLIAVKTSRKILRQKSKINTE